MVFYHLSVFPIGVLTNLVFIAGIPVMILMMTIYSSLLGLSQQITFVCTHWIWVAYEND